MLQDFDNSWKRANHTHTASLCGKGAPKQNPMDSLSFPTRWHPWLTFLQLSQFLCPCFPGGRDKLFHSAISEFPVLVDVIENWVVCCARVDYWTVHHAQRTWHPCTTFYPVWTLLSLGCLQCPQVRPLQHSRLPVPSTPQQQLITSAALSAYRKAEVFKNPNDHLGSRSGGMGVELRDKRRLPLTVPPKITDSHLGCQ